MIVPQFFSFANHQQFCSIFPDNTGWDILSQLVRAGIFLIQNFLAGFFFKITPPPSLIFSANVGLYLGFGVVLELN